MSNLTDYVVEQAVNVLSIDSPTSDMEFVLLHGDCLEMNGFISHLKLPHYVTFQSKLDSLRKRKRRLEDEQGN